MRKILERWKTSVKYLDMKKTPLVLMEQRLSPDVFWGD